MLAILDHWILLVLGSAAINPSTKISAKALDRSLSTSPVANIPMIFSKAAFSMESGEGAASAVKNDKTSSPSTYAMHR